MTTSESKGHNAPCSNRDFDFFYRGLEHDQLLVQQCAGCGKLRSLPSPCCDNCRSLNWTEFALSGQGTVFSYVIHCHPPLPGFATPHPVVVAEMAEGVRLVAAMDETDPALLTIGLPVKAEFVRRGETASYRLRPA